MTNRPLMRFALGCSLIIWSSTNLLSAQDAPSDTLKIIVLDGEDAVNIVKKKTAVQPVVEVRDQNDLPVAGASVLFLLPSSGPGGTFLNGSKSLTVTTNAMGRATGLNFNPAGAGSFKINVTANFRGRVGHQAISQTNFLTAAAAASASTAAGLAAGGAASAAGTAAVGAGAGVGLSSLAIGAVTAGSVVGVGLGTAYSVGAIGCLSPCK